MHVRLVDNLADFAALEPAWNRLAGPAVFRRFAWARAWWAAFGDADRDLWILAAEDQGEVRAIAPFARERSIVHGKCLTLLGGGLACGDNLSLLAEPRSASQAVGALADWLAGPAGRPTWDSIYLDGVTTGDPLLAEWGRRLEEAGAARATRKDVGRYAVDLPDNWEQFATDRGKNTRRLLRKVAARLDDPAIRVQALADPADFEALFATFVDLHGLRWRAEHGGCFTAPAFGRFVREAASNWLGEGMLRLAVLRIGDHPAAGAIAVEHAGVLSCYMFGRDPRFEEERPGWMLSVWLIREAIARGLAQVDFLRGDEAYKLQLGCRATPQEKTTYTSTGLVNRLRGASAAVRAAVSRRRRD